MCLSIKYSRLWWGIWCSVFVILFLVNVHGNGQKNCSELNFECEDLYKKGDLLKSWEIGNKAYEVCKESDKEHYAYALNNKGLQSKLKGNYYEAISLYEKALEFELSIGDTLSSSGVPVTLFNIANLYRSIGLNNKALRYANQAAEYLQLSADSINNSFLAMYFLVGTLNSNLDNSEVAEKNFLDGLELAQQLKIDPSLTAIAYHNLGELYSKNDDFEKAKYFELIADSLFAESVGRDHVYYKGVANTLGKIYLKEKNMIKAQEYFERMKEIIYKNSGEQREKAIVNFNLANFHTANNQLEIAMKYFVDFLDILEQYIFLNFGIIEEKGRANFLQSWKIARDKFSSFCLDHFNSLPKLSGTLYNNSLVFKEIILESSKKIKNTIYNGNDENLKDQYENWLEVKRLVSFQYSLPVNARQLNIDSLVEVQEKMAISLSRKSKVFEQTFRKVSWQDIQLKLEDNEVAIEFLHFPYVLLKPTSRIPYVAVIIRKSLDLPILVPLFDEDDLSKWMAYKGTDIKDYIEEIYRGERIEKPNIDPVRLYELIWQPLEKYLNRGDKIYYSPSGQLHTISMRAIPVDSDTYLSDYYDLQYVSSTRELALDIKVEQTKEQIYRALLIGNVNYDADSLDLVGGLVIKHDSINKNMESQRTDIESLTGQLSSRLSEDGHLKELPWTKIEINQIAEVFELRNHTSRILEKEEASETNLLSLLNPSEKFNVVHLSTHGFFIENPHDAPGKNKSFRNSDDPMYRSGLLLAGANRVWSGGRPSAAMEDGILTSVEISNLDLSNLHLVVLSACDTGLGEIHADEGVYGLQRALKTAGVQNIIMSLWEIPDNEQVVDFMSTFYTFFLSEPNSDVRSAFDKTQQIMKKKYPISLWGAFILI